MNTDTCGDSLYKPLDINRIAGYLEESGSFASFFDHYEERIPQLKLIRAITTCFNESGIGIFEAGTGVGKSLAYLLPALAWAKQNNVRVVVSTGTINLQHQLIEKDVPTALKILGESPKVLSTVLIKGRQNYLCFRRFMQVIKEPDLFEQDIGILQKIQTWAAVSAEGSRSDLPFMPAAALWSKICSESDNCLVQRCPFYDKCFVMKLKKKAEKASLLIVNHHLLFADLASRREGAGYESTAVLPAFKSIIFDEAHTIEDAAQLFFSHTFSRYELTRAVYSLYRIKKGKNAGCLGKITSISRHPEMQPLIISELANMQAAFSILESAAVMFCGKASGLSLIQGSLNNRNMLLEKARTFYAHLTEVVAKLSVLLTEAEPDKDSPYAEAVREGSLVLNRLHAIQETLGHFFHWTELSDYVFWIEKIHIPSGDIPRFNQTPIDMSTLLRESVFMPFDTVIAASATLKIGTSFAYWLGRTGLRGYTAKQQRLDSFESPFPYETNVLLNIPTDAPLPDEKHFQDFVNHAIAKLIELTGGKTLVLFTSYESLKKACAYTRKHLPTMDIFQQGEEDRSKLLVQFKENIESSLFATASFWAGIDVRGESLSHLILVKLPFAVPTDPLFSARADIIEKKGGNSFIHLSIPEAVMQFRQGFGRLMRSKTDRGIVTVLDKRLLTKQYGKIFIDSIAKTRQCFASLSEIVYSIENFLF